MLAGARWLLPSATFTVMVAEPEARPVTVTTFPERVAVQMPVALLLILIAPSPARVMVKVAVGFSASTVMDVGDRLKLPAALPMLCWVWASRRATASA